MTRFQSRLMTATILAPLAALAIPPSYAADAASLAKTPLRHVIIIMQENRSFDQYFGTYPGANGIPPDTCVPLNPTNPSLGCVVPFHDPHDANAGGPHGAPDAQADLDDGITTDKMDGFLLQQTNAPPTVCETSPDTLGCAETLDGTARHDAAGYHTADEIPNYWAYAQKFVLQDQLFEGVRSWSLPSHLDLTSEWVAACIDKTKALTCGSTLNLPTPVAGTEYPWVNLFQLLDKHGVSWKYYLGTGAEPDCENDDMSCDPEVQGPQSPGVPSIWNVAPYFTSVQKHGAAYLAKHNPDADQFLVDIENGTLPEVSWIIPAAIYSEHPVSGVTVGMEYTTSLVNAVMNSPYWKDTAIFIAWDDWGGFYDHVAPPNVDTNDSSNPIQGFGLRVPGILVSAYAKSGTIDHSVLSFDSYATFIEDIFMGGARLNPNQLGNPDNRPDIRDELRSVTFPDGAKAPIGNLMNEFDFKQKPLPPLVLTTHIPTGINIDCSADHSEHCTSSTVTIAWSPVTGPNIPGTYTYHVQRDGTELPQCVTQFTRSCTDTPGSGNHLYRIYSVDLNNVASPLSAAAEADEP